MRIRTQYAVQKFFPNSAFSQIYFEAVANAFDAGAKSVRISIDCDGEIRPTRLVVVIEDDGAGFTDANFSEFAELQEPKDAQHKGLGRLVYLQYFSHVDVESNYGGKTRRFTFSNEFEGDSEVEGTEDSRTGARLSFRGFRRGRLRAYDDLKPEVIKQALIHQFLPLLHRKREAGEDFRIDIEMQTDKAQAQHEFFSSATSVRPSDIPRFETRIVKAPELGAFESLRLSYFIQREGGDGSVTTLASVDDRSIPLPVTQPRPLPAGVAAVFLVESEVFAGSADDARQVVDLPTEVPRSTLIGTLRRQVGAVLAHELPEIEVRNVETQKTLETQYPHLVGLFDTEVVGVLDRKEALDTAQQRFFAQQKEILDCEALDDELYEKSLEVSARTLAEYILYRELIINRLAKLTEEDPEERVHSLIVPQREQFDGGALVDHVYRNNAWLLDDRFMTFRTVLSERRMDEVVSAITLDEETAGGSGRPDIALIFSADPEDPEPVDAVVVEVKRRRVDEREGMHAVNQLTRRARLLVEHCPNIQRVWYFGIVEMDEAFAQMLQDQRWAPLYSKGRLFYFENRIGDVPAPTFMMSFDAVIGDASARNHTFLELLRHEIRRESDASNGG